MIHKDKFPFANLTLFILISIFFLFVIVGSALAEVQDDFCDELNPNLTVSECNGYWEVLTNNSVVMIDNSTTLIINSSVYDDEEIKDGLKNLEEEINDLNFSFENLKNRYVTLNDKFTNFSETSVEEECDSFCLLNKQLESESKIQEYENQRYLKCLSTPQLPTCITILNSNENEEDSQVVVEETSATTSLTDLQIIVSSLQEDLSKQEERIYVLETNNKEILSYVAIVLSLAVFVYFFLRQKKEDMEKALYNSQNSLENQQAIKRGVQALQPIQPQKPFEPVKSEKMF